MNKILHTLLTFVSIIIPGIPFTIVVPIFPLEITRRNMSQIYSGLALSALSIGAFIMPIVLVHIILPRASRLASAVIGYMIGAGSAFVLGLAARISHNTTFAVISIIARVGQGAAAAMTYASITIIISASTKNSNRAILMIFLAQAIAETSGPILGGFLYQTLGYLGIFIVLTGLLIGGGILFYALYRSQVQRFEMPRNQIDNSRLGLLDVLKKPVSFLQLKGPLIALINFYLAQTILNDIDPVLPYRLHDEFGYEEKKISLFFFSFFIASLTAGLLLLIVNDKFPKIYFMVPGNLVASIGFLCLGPSYVLQFPDSIKLMIIGMVLLALGRSLIFYFAVGQIIRLTIAQYPRQAQKSRELSSSLAEMSLALGYLISPILTTTLYQAFHFQITMDILCLIHFIFFCCYLAFTILDRQNHRRSFSSIPEREDTQIMRLFLQQ